MALFPVTRCEKVGGDGFGADVSILLLPAPIGLNAGRQG